MCGRGLGLLGPDGGCCCHKRGPCPGWSEGPLGWAPTERAGLRAGGGRWAAWTVMPACVLCAPEPPGHSLCVSDTPPRMCSRVPPPHAVPGSLHVEPAPFSVTRNKRCCSSSAQDWSVSSVFLSLHFPSSHAKGDVGGRGAPRRPRWARWLSGSPSRVALPRPPALRFGLQRPARRDLCLKGVWRGAWLRASRRLPSWGVGAREGGRVRRAASPASLQAAT